HAARHAHEAEGVEWHESQIEADQPTPEGAFAPSFIEDDAERLGEPVHVTRKVTEERAWNQHVMEMRDQERRIVHQVIDGREGDKHAGHSADDERHDETDGPHHRWMKANAAAIHGEQPVEYLHPGWNRNDHGRDPEKAVDVGIRAHREEMMEPYGERQKSDRRSSREKRYVTEQPFAREGRDHFRENA